ncbi:20771_t:CDS:2, partial [Racocetra persica]
ATKVLCLLMTIMFWVPYLFDDVLPLSVTRMIIIVLLEDNAIEDD